MLKESEPKGLLDLSQGRAVPCKVKVQEPFRISNVLRDKQVEAQTELRVKFMCNTIEANKSDLQPNYVVDALIRIFSDN